MGLIELRLGDEDHKEYAPEGAPEWVPFDRDALDSAPFSVLRPLEKEIRKTDDDMSIQSLLYVEWVSGTAMGIKGAVWLAWKLAGLDTPDWADFDICTNLVRWNRDDDADPPPSGSSEPSETAETTTPSLESSPS